MPGIFDQFKSHLTQKPTAHQDNDFRNPETPFVDALFGLPDHRREQYQADQNAKAAGLEAQLLQQQAEAADRQLQKESALGEAQFNLGELFGTKLEEMDGNGISDPASVWRALNEGYDQTFGSNPMIGAEAGALRQSVLQGYKDQIAEQAKLDLKTLTDQLEQQQTLLGNHPDGDRDDATNNKEVAQQIESLTTELQQARALYDAFGPEGEVELHTNEEYGDTKGTQFLGINPQTGDIKYNKVIPGDGDKPETEMHVNEEFGRTKGTQFLGVDPETGKLKYNTVVEGDGRERETTTHVNTGVGLDGGTEFITYDQNGNIVNTDRAQGSNPQYDLGTGEALRDLVSRGYANQNPMSDDDARLAEMNGFYGGGMTAEDDALASEPMPVRSTTYDKDDTWVRAVEDILNNIQPREEDSRRGVNNAFQLSIAPETEFAENTQAIQVLTSLTPYLREWMKNDFTEPTGDFMDRLRNVASKVWSGDRSDAQDIFFNTTLSSIMLGYRDTYLTSLMAGAEDYIANNQLDQNDPVLAAKIRNDMKRRGELRFKTDSGIPEHVMTNAIAKMARGYNSQGKYDPNFLNTDNEAFASILMVRNLARLRGVSGRSIIENTPGLNNRQKMRATNTYLQEQLQRNVKELANKKLPNIPLDLDAIANKQAFDETGAPAALVIPSMNPDKPGQVVIEYVLGIDKAKQYSYIQSFDLPGLEKGAFLNRKEIAALNEAVNQVENGQQVDFSQVLPKRLLTQMSTFR